MPGHTIFITYKLELRYDYIASYYSILVQIFIYYQFGLKVHRTIINALSYLSVLKPGSYTCRGSNLQLGSEVELMK